MINKNRNREDYSFANINLLGKCNVDCYFCLGKDIVEELGGNNQLSWHFRTDWKNFDIFIQKCKEKGIKKIYITGQNTDSLMYIFLTNIITWLQLEGFMVGLRTNGYLALNKIDIINQCDCNVGYSIHTLNTDTNNKIMGRWDIPRWDKIIPLTKSCRVSIVVNRYNKDEFFSLVRWLSQFPNVKYIQARRISTDTRYDLLKPDIMYYEKLFKQVESKYELKDRFYGAEIYEIYGKEVCFWRTVETSVNSMNYFTDGTVSEEYFVVEGYLKNKI